jgi:hypothetical protein
MTKKEKRIKYSSGYCVRKVAKENKEKINSKLAFFLNMIYKI